jgi:hypothetical protein
VPAVLSTTAFIFVGCGCGCGVGTVGLAIGAAPVNDVAIGATPLSKASKSFLSCLIVPIFLSDDFYLRLFIWRKMYLGFVDK